MHHHHCLQPKALQSLHNDLSAKYKLDECMACVDVEDCFESLEAYTGSREGLKQGRRASFGLGYGKR